MPRGHVLLQMFSSLISTPLKPAAADNKIPSARKLGGRRSPRPANLRLMPAAFTWGKSSEQDCQASGSLGAPLLTCTMARGLHMFKNGSETINKISVFSRTLLQLAEITSREN